MAQSTASTVERVTQQAQSLAAQMGDQAGKAATALRSNRARRQARGRLGELVARARASIALPRMPATARLAWRAGQATGRIQGASALAPLAARGWRLALTHRLRSVSARARLRAQTRWMPLALAGTQFAGRTQQGMRQRMRQVGQLPGMTRNMASAGAATATKNLATRPVRKQQAVARARSARARRRLWRAARLFVIGVAIGAAWAFFFAQRRGPGYDALRERATDSRS